MDTVEQDFMTRYLSFELGNKNYAIDIMSIKEILEYENVDKIPLMPDFIDGVIDLRGNIIAVINLAYRLDEEVLAVSESTCILIIEINLNNQLIEVGLKVDSVQKVLDIEPGSLEEPPTLAGQIDTQYISAVGRSDNHFLVLLDTQKILNIQQIDAITSLKTDDLQTKEVDTSEINLEISNNLENKNTFLSFTIGNEIFGIEIFKVREVIEYQNVTQVPMTSKLMAGVINLRGNVVPVVNLSERLSLPFPQRDKRTCIVMVSIKQEDTIKDIGFMVSGVSAVLEIEDEDIEPKPVFGSHIDSTFIRGMAKRNEDFFVLLNIESLLDYEQLIPLI